METHVPTRDEALALLKEYNSDAALINHALAVEAVMSYMAKKRGYENEIEKWSIIGLVHRDAADAAATRQQRIP